MILDDIIKAKQKEIAGLPPINFLKRAALNVLPAIDFLPPAGKFFLIAEIKKTSPSKGVLRPDFSPETLAKQYAAGGAAAISVVTERDFFGGHPDYIRRIKAEVQLPILRKDFIVAEAQVYESRIAGADAILLIARLLDEATLIKFVDLAKSLGMRVLLEVHDPADVEKALKTSAQIIGINNRDLQDFRVDLRTTLGLIKHCPQLKEKILVAESGISTKPDIDLLRANGVAGALVGEALLIAPDPAAKIKELLA